MAKATEQKTISIKAPNFQVLTLRIKGAEGSPYVQHRFWKKADIMATQRAGSVNKSKKVRAARDFEADYEESKHIAAEGGWIGIPAPSFRNAMISACRTVGYKMTHAKLAAFVLSDGLNQDGQPIIRIQGEPEMWTAYARNDNGSVDIRARPMWREWSAFVRIRFDADMLTAEDVLNLMHRAGAQVGIGEGRPDSKSSAGLGFGLFEVVSGGSE
jgi:hypothetical protein